jgi:predicted transcriptional regulator
MISQLQWVVKMSDKLGDLLKEYGGPPVNIEAVIRSMGIELDKKANLAADISGQIERLGEGKYKISANRADNYFRQRFTMAHELGHYLLHRDLIGDGHSDDRAYRSTDSGAYAHALVGPAEEAAANRIAAQILMPAERIRSEVSDHPSVEALATRFQVSKKAMEIRLQTLEMDPGGRA